MISSRRPSSVYLFDDDNVDAKIWLNCGHIYSDVHDSQTGLTISAVWKICLFFYVLQ